MGRLRSITVHYADGTSQDTNCNGVLSEDEVRSYYVGQEFPFGERFPSDPHRMVKATAVTFNGFLITCPKCGMGQFPEPRADGNCNICGKPLN